jgi:hypothetical protein
MPLTRFPDHEDKRVFLSTVLSFNLPPADSAHSDRLSIAVFWVDQGTPSAAELTLDFATDLLEHGALGIVCGGSAAEEVGALFEQAIEEGEFVRDAGEEIGIWVLPETTPEELLWSAAEEAMLPDIFADQPCDIIVWARSGDPALPRLRQLLPRLTDVIDEIYELGGEEDE